MKELKVRILVRIPLHEVEQRLWIAEGAEDVMLRYKV